MASQDDLALLKRMYERGEISDAQYDTLRRHVLWGTPLPDLIEEQAPAPAPQAWSTPTVYRPSAGPPARRPRDEGPSTQAWTPPQDWHRPPGPDRPPPPARGEAAQARMRTPPQDWSRRPGPGRPPPPAQDEADPAASQDWSRPPAVDRPAPPVRDKAGPARARTPQQDRARLAADRPAPPARDEASAQPWSSPAGPGRPAPPAREDNGSTTQHRAPPRDWSRPPAQPDHGETVAPSDGPPGAPARPAAFPPLDEPGDVDKPRPRRRAPRLVTIGTSMVIALALVAAGVWWFAFRETGIAAPAYARTVCTSVRDWQEIVDGRSRALVGSIRQQDDRVAIRSAVRTYYTDLTDGTDGLRTAIVNAGVADVPGGEAYADSLSAAIGGQATALRDLTSRAERLDTGSATVFQTSLQSLLTGAQTAVSGVTAALARPEGGTPAALRIALSDEPACAPYVG